MRHAFTPLLAAVTCAMLVGSRSFVAIGEWIAEIGAGAGRSARELAADVEASATAVRAALLAIPGTASDEIVQLRPGVRFPAHALLRLLLVEVVLHHTDLGAGYTGADWAPEFTALDLPEPQATWRAERRARTT